MGMETFIVRVYRRDGSDPKRMAGAVEIPGVARVIPFDSLVSLERILSAHKSERKAMEASTTVEETSSACECKRFVFGVKLYQAQMTPSCRKVRMFLHEKSLSVQMEDATEGFGLSTHFVQRYPHRTVPMLELEDGTQIGESMAICRYLEELYPEPPLFGTGPLNRVLIDIWERRAYLEGAGAFEEVFRNSHPLMVNRGLAGTSEPVPQIPALVERGHGRVRRFFAKFEQRLNESRYVGGDFFSVADISTLCAVDFGRFVGLEIPEHCENLLRWYKEVSFRSSASA